MFTKFHHDIHYTNREVSNNFDKFWSTYKSDIFKYMESFDIIC